MQPSMFFAGRFKRIDLGCCLCCLSRGSHAA
ncbi:MAG: hypothetical protein KatS3mg071_2657 [Meiothermus sp.]|nr:MAG: hypothetical protein KatS3mg071_2657 [Meiothermus sp.]